jgi:hypothetical protein
MPKRQAKHTVIVVRAGKRQSIHPGQPFDFTEEEIKHIQAAHGDKSVSKVTREVDDEDEDVEQHNTGGQNLIDETGDTGGETSGKNATATATQKPVVKKAAVPAKKAASGL